ncbi:MAG: methyltransferase family protein [Candidatus Hodarchaeota archaeon]
MDGPYKFSRNPIYLSVIIILIGLAILAGSLSIFIIAILVFIILRKLFVSWEEKNLEEVFGKEYLEYKKHVR